MSRPTLPKWSHDLRDKYLAGEASLFLLHGNVRDVQRWVGPDGRSEWLDLRRFLSRFLSRTRDVVAVYDVSRGLTFPEPSHELAFRDAIDRRREHTARGRLGPMPSAPREVVEAVEELITSPAQASGVVIDFVETIAPQGDLSFMSNEDKATLVALQRWSSDPAFLGTDNLVILITEHLSDVSRRVVASPQLKTLMLPFPDLEHRQKFIEAHAEGVPTEMPLNVLSQLTAGLSLLQIRALLRGARLTERPITYSEVARRKKVIIEQECHGLVEVVNPRHDFSHVGGMERVKADLMRVANAVKEGRTNRVPMGMIFVGPMGTGKTFVANAFARESGLTVLTFKNFRERWVGSTEGNLEKILDLVDALGYVLLIIDEADRSLGGNDNDGGTSSRVIARLKEFMSDTSHRGRVVILMMTNRPDKLDVDLKRPGRFDMKIPFFFPEEHSERELILQALLRKNDLSLEDGVSLDGAAERTEGYSGAELELVLLAAADISAADDRDCISQADLDRAVEDVIPSRDTRMLAYMELLAVFEASSRRMLPDRYREMSTEEVQKALDELQIVLGPRAR
ncbi:MAG: ATP-binding protein [Deltaproteobacteria bacterium]|nr:MAG: ATP-binding protein [Deltaproteobacteria bacterium]